tara:strand:- start:4093 stop:5427 length:1335 start_codon:yes stop_codon:yes gene_type:complete
MAINEETLKELEQEEKDRDIESVAQPNADYRESIDDALIAAEVISEKRDYDRLKKLEEDGKINIDVQGNALKNENSGKGKGNGNDEKKGGFTKFASGVGKALGKFSQGLEKKLETVYDDREKRTLFLSGLNTLIESSSYSPITQAKSPIGKIASGVKKGFLESEAIGSKRKEIEAKRLQALKQPKRVADPKDKVIAELFTKYQDKYEEGKASKLASERTYNELLKNKNYTPTGILENFFQPLNEIAVSLGYGDLINNVRKKYAENPDYVPSEEEIVALKSIIDSDAGTRILGKAKELYPVSNVDLQLLLRGSGSLATNPEALKVLLSAERALNLIEDEAFPLANQFAYPGGQVTGSTNFAIEASDLAAKNLSEKFAKEVKDETLVELFGTKEKNPFRIIQAKLYQDLQADKEIQEVSAFDKFLGAKREKETEIDNIKNKYKKNK